MRFALLLLVCTLTASCSGAIDADPALWRVQDREGHRGWLFGTIHSSDRPLAWRTPPVARALEDAGSIMVEVGNVADDAALAATFAQLARSADRPALTRRVPPAARPALAALLRKAGYGDDDFAAMDTWAAALTLAKAHGAEQNPRNGVDRAVIAAAQGRPVLELEGAAAQLSLFDALPEREQGDLLAAVATEATQPSRDLAAAWRRGDMTAIEAETRAGLLADPELREVLFTGRNRRWAARVAQAIHGGRAPFVAVGAAHMAGPDGLPAMLAQQGFTVTRIK
ncbi:TraB/GumN family protein [Novosphingobium soli]|uniref:TraB/GumN family protein n=2 Tax=Novosphingobium soli TaxID=574956 RepID=A0ABV6CQZ8_9SPHN